VHSRNHCSCSFDEPCERSRYRKDSVDWFVFRQETRDRRFCFASLPNCARRERLSLGVVVATFKMFHCGAGERGGGYSPCSRSPQPPVFMLRPFRECWATSTPSSAKSIVDRVGNDLMGTRFYSKGRCRLVHWLPEIRLDARGGHVSMDNWNGNPP